jgi:hypothetical protein
MENLAFCRHRFFGLSVGKTAVPFQAQMRDYGTMEQNASSLRACRRTRSPSLPVRRRPPAAEEMSFYEMRRRGDGDDTDIAYLIMLFIWLWKRSSRF